RGFHAADPEVIGVQGLNKVNAAAESVEGDRSFRVLGGYDQIAETLRAEAEQKGAVLQLNTTVRVLRWRERAVELETLCAGHARTFRAAHAIVTLPLGVLQAAAEALGAVRFEPPLAK